MQLQNFDKETFLRDYWQQKPLLIKNPWREWSNPLAPNELAGLACEDDIESRLIVQQRDQWLLEHGPLAETRFSKLPKKNWTLLVQAVDHYVPEVAELLDAFRFIPNWRIDDVMVSYAADQGGVGAHFDQYDVFLIQGLGQRLWQVGTLCDSTTPLLPHADLRLLQEFTNEQEWLLEPGDILYLPPRYAHNGIAVGDDCMTYSIGFRAPARSELLAHFCDDILADLNDDDRFADPQRSLSANPGEIAASDLTQLHQMAIEKLLDIDGFGHWFGRFSTMPKYPDHLQAPDQPLTVARLRKYLEQGLPLLRNPSSRLAFIQTQNGTTLFADGEAFLCDTHITPLVEKLCAEVSFSAATDMLQAAAAQPLLLALLNQGTLVFDDD
jgi:50S ribosomal protein L16 3-hydroxylase